MCTHESGLGWAIALRCYLCSLSVVLHSTVLAGALLSWLQVERGRNGRIKQVVTTLRALVGCERKWLNLERLLGVARQNAHGDEKERILRLLIAHTITGVKVNWQGYLTGNITWEKVAQAGYVTLVSEGG